MDQSPASAESLFEEALKLPAKERAAFVARACQGNERLHRRLQRLLEAEAEAGSFLDEPLLLGMSVRTPEMKAERVPGEQPGDRIGRYKLLEQIGEGGCGLVFMAEQLEPVRRKVALKVIKLGMDTKQVVARFEAERQALALMDHPHIAKVLDAGATDAGRPFFVMELVKGIPVTRYADKHQLNTRQRLELLIQICQAIEHAHQKGIIHRDLKPSNILIADHDGVAMPKIIDFGIAKATADQPLTDKTLFTAFAQFIGTPAYMSPEQAQLSGLDIDTRSDIYSLGVLLYELLTGRPPFDARRLLEAGLDGIRRIIGEEEPPMPSTRFSTLDDAEQTSVAKQRKVEPPTLLSTIRGDLDWIVMKCLEKDRARRYETASGLAADLQRHLSDEPVIASPSSRLYRFQKMVRRNKPLFAALAAIATVLMVGAIVSASLAVWALRERASAQRARAESEQRARAEAGARLEAREQRDRAEQEGARSRERLVGLNMANGVRLLGDGDYARALLWFHEALKNDIPSSERSRLHRLRLGAVLDACPRLVQMVLVDGAIHGLHLSPDGKELTTVYRDAGHSGNLRLQQFDLESGKQRWQTRFITDAVLAYHDSSRLLVTAASNGVIHVRNAATGESLAALRDLWGPVTKVALHPKTEAVLLVQSNTVRLWNSRSGAPLSPPLTQPGIVSEACFNPDGSRFVVATFSNKQWSARISTWENCQVRVWDTRSGRPVMPAMELGPRRVRECLFSPDGRLLLSVDEDQILGWDAQTGVAAGITIQSESVGHINRVTFSPDGRWIVTASGAVHRMGGARVWETRTGKLLRSLTPNPEQVDHAIFSPGGDLVATASADHFARVWDVESGMPLTPQLAHEAKIVALLFAPDGRRLITGTAAGLIRIWDLGAQKTPRSLAHGGRRVRQAEFSLDGTKILTACYDGKVRLWDWQTGGLLLDPLDHGCTMP